MRLLRNALGGLMLLFTFSAQAFIDPPVFSGGIFTHLPTRSTLQTSSVCRTSHFARIFATLMIRLTSSFRKDQWSVRSQLRTTVS